MKNWVKWVTVPIAILMISGCLKYTYSLSGVAPNLVPTGSSTVAVASQDQRSYVVSGKKRPQLVGVIRAAFGNPVHMTTSSGRPLSDEMGDVITGALNRKGYKTNSVTVAATDSKDQVRAKLGDTGARKLIHFQIDKWKNDTYNRVRLEYILNLTVLDGKGKLLAQKKISGDDNLGGAGMNTLSGTRRKVPPAFKKIIEELFNAPDIVKALEQ